MTDWQAASPVQLDGDVAERLDALAGALLSHPHAPLGARSADDIRDRHISDSLSGLASEALRQAGLIADRGAGAGLPGLVIAACLPDAQVELIEASSRKCRIAIEIAGEARISNAIAVDRRSEEWAAADGRERYDAVCARAVGQLAELCELASPLLREGGSLVAWKGPAAEREAGTAAAGRELTAMEAGAVIPVRPFAASSGRRLCVYRKGGPTPAGLPRRPGVAHKRPLGS